MHERDGDVTPGTVSAGIRLQKLQTLIESIVRSRLESYNLDVDVTLRTEGNWFRIKPQSKMYERI